MFISPRNVLALSLIIAVAACGTDDNKTGVLHLDIVDAPVDGVDQVWVQFSGIELHGPDGRITHTFASPKQIDLLNHTGTDSTELVSDLELTAGDYQWLRLLVDTEGALDTYLVDNNGLSHELTIPSGAESGLKLNRGFTLAQGNISDFTIDFDVRRSLVEDANGYKLKPTLRIEDNLSVGTLTGTVSQTLISAHCEAEETGAVYVYDASADLPAPPDDIGGTGGQVITTANVSLENDNAYHYTVGFLASGRYMLGFTCQADDDAPESNEDIAFHDISVFDIVANQTTTVDLDVPAP